MGRTAKTATAEKPLPLPLRFLAAWIGMWLGEHQARVIAFCAKKSAEGNARDFSGLTAVWKALYG
jgi:hypothetical protein